MHNNTHTTLYNAVHIEHIYNTNYTSNIWYMNSLRGTGQFLECKLLKECLEMACVMTERAMANSEWMLHTTFLIGLLRILGSQL